VTSGQRIGFVGETGIATGPHLYFEVMFDDVRVDPLALPAAIPIRLSKSELTEFRHVAVAYYAGQERDSLVR
jgi:murein DD-endopeptidase MepM/ murein hydrolase activator NlpD